jgi:hypothetical protein
VYAPAITLGEVLTKLGEGDIDQPIAFSNKNLSHSEHNYNTRERAGITMVYVMQK